jgi:hypothetical protein
MSTVTTTVINEVLTVRYPAADTSPTGLTITNYAGSVNNLVPVTAHLVILRLQ